MRFWLPALVAIAVLPAGAHHPFTPYYDASKPGSITGVVAELRVINPHVVLMKDFRERLQPGTRITISGWPAIDQRAQAFSGRTATFADGSTMLFGSTPDGGDRWSCAPGPCSYTYPDVRSR